MKINELTRYDPEVRAGNLQQKCQEPGEKHKPAKFLEFRIHDQNVHQNSNQRDEQRKVDQHAISSVLRVYSHEVGDLADVDFRQLDVFVFECAQQYLQKVRKRIRLLFGEHVISRNAPKQPLTP